MLTDDDLAAIEARLLKGRKENRGPTVLGVFDFAQVESLVAEVRRLRALRAKRDADDDAAAEKEWNLHGAFKIAEDEVRSQCERIAHLERHLAQAQPGGA